MRVRKGHVSQEGGKRSRKRAAVRSRNNSREGSSLNNAAEGHKTKDAENAEKGRKKKTKHVQPGGNERGGERPGSGLAAACEGDGRTPAKNDRNQEPKGPLRTTRKKDTGIALARLVPEAAEQRSSPKEKGRGKHRGGCRRTKGLEHPRREIFGCKMKSIARTPPRAECT